MSKKPEMTVVDLARKLYDVCAKDGKDSIIDGIDFIHDVMVTKMPASIQHDGMDEAYFDILLDDAQWLRVTVTRPHQSH
jgi:hypothetical protein